MEKTKFIVRPSVLGALFKLTGDATATLLAYRIYSRGAGRGMINYENNSTGWAVLSRKEWMVDTGMTIHQYNRAMKILKDTGIIDRLQKHWADGQSKLWVRINAETMQKIEEMTVTQSQHPTDSASEAESSISDSPPVPESGHERPSKYKNLNGQTEEMCSAAHAAPAALVQVTKILVEEDSGEDEMDKQKVPGKGKKIVEGKMGQSWDTLKTQRGLPKKGGTDLTRIRNFEMEWKRMHSKAYPGEVLVPWTGREQGFAKSLISKMGFAMPGKVTGLVLAQFLSAVMEQWAEASEYVQGEKGLKTVPEYPNIGFIAAAPQEFLRWYLQGPGTTAREDDVQSVAKPKASSGWKGARRLDLSGDDE